MVSRFSRCSGGHLGQPNGTILAILNLYVVLAQSILRFRRRYSLKNFKMAAILDIGTELFLAILNLYVAPVPPIKFRLNLTYGLGGDVV